MFRASCIGSEEVLPAFGAYAIKEGSCDSSSPDENTELIFNKSNVCQYGLTSKKSTITTHKYPIAVFFILIVKFFEAFAANGIRTILALYLRDYIYFSENLSTIILHVFNFFGQFCPIFGAILADSYWGNVRTIGYFYFIYGLGWILLSVTSYPNIGISLIFIVSLSLLFIAIGNGSIRACITSLGALQFKLPEQTKKLAGYFSLYYFVYYFGIFISKILPPMIRANTQCFNKTDCYPAVFLTLGGSFLISWIVFSIGKLSYKQEKPTSENILVKFYGCIKYALVEQWKLRRIHNFSAIPKRVYWLHYAIGQYDESFVNDVAKVLKISKLFIPLPIYFALLAQQDSSWTFQASMMNTKIGNVNIQADQAKAMGPILLFIFIPFWQYVCIPLTKYIFDYELKPLTSVAIGGVCSALSFVSAGILQNYIISTSYKDINILWQIPQFALLMMGELLLSIPGLQFAFTQAPHSMKSVVTAAWFINNAFGNLLVVLITKLNFFQTQSSEYFFYASLMFISIIVFIMLAKDFILHERLGSFYSNSSGIDELNVNDNEGKLNKKDELPSTSKGSTTTNDANI